MRLAVPLLFVALGAAVAGVDACTATGAPKPQTVADLKALEADALEGLPVACMVVDVVDPAATAVCAILDAADNVIATATARGTPAAVTALVAAKPMPASVAASIQVQRAVGRARL